MVLRRRRAQDEAAAPRPAWRDRFDEAAAMIRSRPQPDWIEDRIHDMATALTAAHSDLENLSKSIDQLDAAGTAAQLKQALRETERRPPMSTEADGERRVATLRRRYDAVNDLMNQRHELEQRIADSIADLELLAVESVRSHTSATADTLGLDGHLRQLEMDLQALAAARKEVEAW
jgi:hypothetical protein